MFEDDKFNDAKSKFLALEYNERGAVVRPDMKFPVSPDRQAAVDEVKTLVANLDTEQQLYIKMFALE